LCDQNLGRLAKWLRIMGFDAEFMPFWDRAKMRSATACGRVVLTRRKKMVDQKGFYVVDDDNIMNQLQRIEERFHLRSKRRPFSRCCICNIELVSVEPQEVHGLVPEYVYSTQETFARCPSCRKIYWKGTHIAKSIDLINRIGGKQ